MVDLSKDMAALLERLDWGSGADSARGQGSGGQGSGGLGRVVQFVGAKPGEGVSTVAREFARVAAPRARRGVWLIELDLMSGGQHAAIEAEPRLYGALGAATRASADGSTFFDVSPRIRAPNGQPWPDAGYLDAFPVGRARWWVTRFRREALRPGQTVRILNSPNYWNMMRRHADLIVVDAPAAQRSRVALATAALVDANVLVVAADRRDIQAPVALRDGLINAGGRCAGLVFNRAGPEPPGFLKALGA
jgi:Mrp family chromosome partitioning ATPase